MSRMERPAAVLAERMIYIPVTVYTYRYQSEDEPDDICVHWHYLALDPDNDHPCTLNVTHHKNRVIEGHGGTPFTHMKASGTETFTIECTYGQRDEILRSKWNELSTDF